MSAPLLDVIVVGGGVAGMTYATQLIDQADGRAVRVRILSKAMVQVSNSYAAQGGVAAVMRMDDSYKQHLRDTLMVGAGRNDPNVVRLVVREGPARIRGLITLGAHFDADAHGNLDLAREGGHSAARVVHHRDRTGEEIVRVLQRKVKQCAEIEVVEDQRVIDLLTENRVNGRRCIGVRCLDLRDGSLVDRFAQVVVLAAGGAGQVYQHTTNPAGATGDGIAMARRAGVALRDMAFVQFHPTAVYSATNGSTFLISEAVRGAGARLLRMDREPLMPGQHPMGDLAPRNIVARAIHREMQRSGAPHVWLDASPIGVTRFAAEFPAIARECQDLGIVPGRDLIPVMPAAHYLCGGIRTDSRGRTDMPGLYAVGECACSGLHGADRLASNSLLEALVIPGRAAQRTWAQHSGVACPPPQVVRQDKLSRRRSALVGRNLAMLRRTMSIHAGILRERDGLIHALQLIARLERSMSAAWARPRWTSELIDLRDLLGVARAITEAALDEPRSIGAHFLKDEPAQEPQPAHSK